MIASDSAPVRRALIDTDRRTDSRSLSIETVGDQKFFHGTTGVLAAGSNYRLYLTGNGKVGGERFFDKTPAVSVYKDDDAAAGGLPRGQGPLGPGYSFNISPHTGFVTSWDKVNEKWYVKVTNSTSVSCDFLVVARGI